MYFHFSCIARKGDMTTSFPGLSLERERGWSKGVLWYVNITQPIISSIVIQDANAVGDSDFKVSGGLLPSVRGNVTTWLKT